MPPEGPTAFDPPGKIEVFRRGKELKGGYQFFRKVPAYWRE